MHRDFKGVWIPRAIWLSTELSLIEKCLLVEIDSLDCSEKHCYAANSRMAEYLGCSEPTVKRAIAKLIEKGLLSAVYKKTHEGTIRTLKTLPIPQIGTDQNDPSDGSKRSPGTDQIDPLLNTEESNTEDSLPVEMNTNSIWYKRLIGGGTK
jgi:hypothetical protein